MKRWIGFCLLFLLICYPVNARAAAGSIKVQLPEDFDGVIYYMKVASMENGLWQLEEKYKESTVDLNDIKNAAELEEAARTLLLYMKKNDIYMEKCEGMLLQDLEEGLYLISFGENSRIEILPALVSVPDWSGEGLVYEVTMNPKYVEKHTTPDTGWDSPEVIYLVSMLFSFVGMMCLVWCNHRRHLK